MTLIEILAAALIGAVVAGGVMAAFITALRISQGAAVVFNLSALSGQTLERYRNRIACDDAWFNPVTCTPVALPVNAPDPAPGVTRTYTVTALDCDGVAGPGDCFQVMAKVSN